MKIKLYFLLLFFIFCLGINAQLMEPILKDTMTLSQAKYELQREMSTISYYYYNDYYGQRLGDRFKYYKEFRRKVEPFELLPVDTIKNKLKKGNWKNYFHHTNRSEESSLWISHDFRGNSLNKAKLYVPRKLKTSFIPKKIFYYGGVQDNPQILKTDTWYKNRKYIDSLLADLTIYYPIESKVVSISSTIAEKKDLGGGSFVWLISNDGKFMDIGITDNIERNLAAIHGISSDGKRYEHSRNSYTPKQPSSEMFSYASECYMYCKQLIQNIDDGKYRSVKDLMKEFDETRPKAPSIQWVYRYGFKTRTELESLEFTYFSKYDSLTFESTMLYDSKERKGDYVVVEKSTGDRIIRGVTDKDGKWIIKPSIKTAIIDEVAGAFYKVEDKSHSGSMNPILVFLDEKKKESVKVKFDIKENVNDTILITEIDELFGAVHRTGRELLPIQFLKVTYNKDWRLFIAKLNKEIPGYQLYTESGKLALPGVFRLIEIDGDLLYTTQIENDREIIKTYDKNLKLIKFEAVKYNKIDDDPKPESVDKNRTTQQLSDNLFWVSEDGLMGMCDKDDNTIVPVIYSTVWYDESVNLIVAMSKKRQFSLFYIDGKRSFLNEFSRVDIKESIIYVSNIVDGTEITSVYDKDLKRINKQGTSVESKFNSSFEPILVRDQDGRQFLMDENGQKILLHSNMYQYLDGCHSGRVLVTPRRFAPSNPIYGYMDLKGNIVVPFHYTKAYSFRGKYAYVEDNTNSMFITTDNKVYKKLPTKVKSVYLADNLENTRYRLLNGDVYDGNLNLISIN